MNTDLNDFQKSANYTSNQLSLMVLKKEDEGVNERPKILDYGFLRQSKLK